MSELLDIIGEIEDLREREADLFEDLEEAMDQEEDDEVLDEAIERLMTIVAENPLEDDQHE